MFKNYFKVSWRNLTKNKTYSTINILGLAIGLAVSMLIMLYVSHETNFDSFHKNAKKIFWIEGESKTGNETNYSNRMGYYTAPILKQYDPTVESFLRIKNSYENAIVQAQENINSKFVEKKFVFADNNFFSFFSFDLIEGNRNEVLKNPFSVVISAKIAKKYFGDIDPIGKVVRYNNKYNFSITGIAKVTPSNSSIDFDFVADLSSFTSIEKEMISSQAPIVQMGFINTYVLLNKPSDASHVENSLNKLAKEGAGAGQPTQDFFHVLPLREMHSDPNISSSSNNKYLKVFPIIAISVLLLALINYVSLSTARSTLRAKEVGIRKTIGADKKQIAMQFFVESFIYSSLAFIIGYIICTVVQPYFFNFLQIHIDNSFLRAPQMLIAFLGLLLITIFLTSIYPSILLSNFSPSSVLYGKLSKQAGGAAIRKFFTVFQFMLCISLIICGLIIKEQLYFFKHKDTGINRTNIVMFPVSPSTGKHFQPFVNDVKSVSAIKRISFAATLLYMGSETYYATPKNGKTDIFISVIHVDESFIPMLRLKWKSPPKDSISYLNQKSAMLNETAVQQLNFDENPLDEKVQLATSEFQVKGVLKDFNYESLQKKIGPLCIIVNKQNDTLASWANEGGFLYAEIKPNVNTSSVIDQIENIFKKYDSEKLFEYYFMDDAFNEMYKAEEKLSNLSNIFVLITLLIACLGLFGLSAFIAQQRVKEIGVRKVMGANSVNIIALLSKDFIKLIFIAILIASPIAWWIMNNWLQSFAYRIHINAGVFLVAGISAILIGVLTVSSQALKAALANPVNSLRSE